MANSYDDDCGCDSFGPLCDDCSFYAAQDGEIDDE